MYLALFLSGGGLKTNLKYREEVNLDFWDSHAIDMMPICFRKKTSWEASISILVSLSHLCKCGEQARRWASMRHSVHTEVRIQFVEIISLSNQVSPGAWTYINLVAVTFTSQAISTAHVLLILNASLSSVKSHQYGVWSFMLSLFIICFGDIYSSDLCFYSSWL